MLGPDLLLDSLYLYMDTIVGGIGLILNVLSFVVFLDKEFEMKLYSYMRVYTINSALISLITGLAFVSNALRYFSWTHSYPAQVFYVYVYIPVLITGYYYGTLLDMIITLDRISFFLKPVKKLFILGPYKLCAVCLAFCFITNASFYFNITTQMITVTINSTRTVEVWFNTQSAFN
jgi:hypothetical protein